MKLSDEIARFADDKLRLRLLRSVLMAVAGSGAYRGSAGIQASEVHLPPSEGLDALEAMVGPCLNHLDAGDRYAGVATPARTALSLFDAHLDWATGINDLEREHGLDAVMRLVGLGLVAESVCEGDSDASAHQFLQTESGCAALAWFAAVEIVLAFASPDDPIDGDRLLELLDDHLDAGVDAWGDIADQRSLARARIVVNNWTDWLNPVIAAASERVAAIATAVRDALGDAEMDADGLAHEAMAVGVYRALTARHVAEHVHGSVGRGSGSSEATVRAELGAAQQSLTHLRETSSGVEQASDGAAKRLGAIEQSEERIQAQRERLRSTIEGLKNQRSKRAEALGAGGKNTDHAIRARDEAASNLGVAQRALALAQAAVSPVADAVDVSVVDALAVAHRQQLTAHRAVHKLLGKGVDFRRALSVHAGWMADEIHQQSEVKSARIAALREAIAAMRATRRTAVRQQVSRAASTGALADRVEASGSNLEQARNNLRHAREDVEPRSKAIRDLQSKLRKRDTRCRDLRTRVDDHDAVVQEVSSSIAELRGGIEAVTARILERIALRDEQQRLLRAEVRADLDSTRQRLDVAQTTLAPAKGAAKQTADSLAALNPRCVALQERIASMTERLATHHEARQSMADGREQTAQLAVAARDMLRSCAGRLDASHAVLREAQAAADKLMKEHRLRADRLRTSDRAIQAAQDRERNDLQAIDEATKTTAALRAALERNADAIETAEVARSEARAQRRVAIRSEQQALRKRIASLRELMEEAADDRRGLAAAEVTISEQRSDSVRAREMARARLHTLQSNRMERVGVIEKKAARRARVRQALLDADASLLGLRLTVDGSVRTLERARSSVAICRERYELAQNAVQDAEAREARRIDAVADAQSWVDRTRAVVGSLRPSAVANVEPAESAVPRHTPPIPSTGSKLDHLLQKVTANPGHVDDVPDPAAAPNVDGVRTVVRRVFDAPNDSEDATQVVPRSAPPPDSEAATEMFRPEDLLARLEAEDATIVVPKRGRPAPPHRDDDSD